MRSFSCLLALTLCFPAVSASTGSPSPGAKKDQYISLLPAEEVKVAPGKTVDAVVRFTVDEGLHIQANPASKRNLIPTTVTLVEDGGILPGEPVYPNGKPFRLEGSDEDIATYDGKVEIRVPITAASSAKPGKVNLDGKIRYQACNAKSCFFPMVLKLSLPVRVVSPKG